MRSVICMKHIKQKRQLNLLKVLLCAALAYSVITLPGTVSFAQCDTSSTWIIYSDSTGVAEGSDAYIWPYPETGDSIDLVYPRGCPLDSHTCARTVATSWAGWGLFLIKPDEHTIDLIACNYCGLAFCVMAPCELWIEIEDANNNKSTALISDYGWDETEPTSWQYFYIPIYSFDGQADLENIFGIFLVTAKETCTFYVDYIHWVSCVPVKNTTWSRIKALQK